MAGFIQPTIRLSSFHIGQPTFHIFQPGRKIVRPYSRMDSRRAIRSSIGGWVLNKLVMPPARNGFTMNMCAVAGLASIGTR